MAKISVTLQKIVYALVFCLLLPLLLQYWARHTSDVVRLPVPPYPLVGALLAATGLSLILWAMHNLWYRGGGLPMNAFPPQHFVASGAYRLCRHPIYTGAVLLCTGTALYAQSPGGLWLVSPLFALLIVAYVAGFEREVMAKQFGARPMLHYGLFSLPPDNGHKAAFSRRLLLGLKVWLVWLLLYEAFVWLGVPPDAWYSNGAWDEVVPLWGFSVVFYVLLYPWAGLLPLWLRQNRQLRGFTLDAFWGMALIFYCYLIIPAAVRYGRLPENTLWLHWIALGREYDSAAAALPSFHVFWALLAARYSCLCRPQWRMVWALLAVLVIVSCLTTHNHTLADVLAGMAAYWAIRHRQPIYHALLRAAEYIANSWHEWRFGRLRLINHGFYAALGGVSGFLVLAYLLPQYLWAVWLLGVAGFIGAGLWAQWVEGSSALLRPFGYYGSVFGIVLAGCLIAAGSDLGGWTLLGAAALAACPIQLFGRCRCLIQGCCHGIPTDMPGIRFFHDKSRVCKLAGWQGKNLHPTQFYSIAANFLSFFLLWRLYRLQMPASFIAGMYLILSGAFRFVEESLRGEPQTPYFLGMRVYQWLALASVLAGILFTCLPSAPLFSGSLPAGWLLHAIAYFVLIWCVYGLDYPNSTLRFSRLTQE